MLTRPVLRPAYSKKTSEMPWQVLLGFLRHQFIISLLNSLNRFPFSSSIYFNFKHRHVIIWISWSYPMAICLQNNVLSRTFMLSRTLRHTITNHGLINLFSTEDLLHALQRSLKLLKVAKISLDLNWPQHCSESSQLSQINELQLPTVSTIYMYSIRGCKCHQILVWRRNGLKTR